MLDGYITNVTRNLRNAATSKKKYEDLRNAATLKKKYEALDELDESMNVLIESLAYSDSKNVNIRFLAIEAIQSATWFLAKNKDKWLPKSTCKKA